MNKYPKLILFTAISLVAYFLSALGVFGLFSGMLSNFGALSLLLAGLLFSFGFTTPLAIAYFIEIAPSVNPYFAAALGGTGAMLSDLSIFEISRFSLHDEFLRLRASQWFQRVRNFFWPETLSQRVREYMIWVFAGLIIASPLPDEIGLTMLGSVSSIQGKRLGILCLVMNMIGILLILLAARVMQG